MSFSPFETSTLAGTVRINQEMLDAMSRNKVSDHLVSPLLPTPRIFSEKEIADLKSQILLKLLEVEIARCNTMAEEDDRTDAMAQVVEGGDHILDRVSSGIRKYLEVLGLAESLSFEDSPSEARVLVTPHRERLFSQIEDCLCHLAVPIDRAELVDGSILPTQGRPYREISLRLRVSL